MARIAGINIPINKVVHTALTYIHGIGDYNSKLICQKLNIPLNKRVNIDFKSFKRLILINAGRKIRNAIIFFTKLMSMD